MMNYAWVFMLTFSFVTAALCGEMQSLSNAILSAAGDAVTLCIKLAGSICLWGGLMNIAKESGITTKVCRLLSPLLRIVFPSMDLQSPAANAIAMNVTANLLGLGNAATPLGIEAMRCLKKDCDGKSASDNMVKFVVLNSAALHLLPTTVAALRLDAGAVNPFDIMPAAWLSSSAALTVGLTAACVMLKIESIGRGGGSFAKHRRMDTARCGAGHCYSRIHKKSKGF